MTHDKFCPADTPLGGGCECEVIAAIRADEREKAAQRVAALQASRDPLPPHRSLWVELNAAVAAARGEAEQ